MAKNIFGWILITFLLLADEFMTPYKFQRVSYNSSVTTISRTSCNFPFSQTVLSYKDPLSWTSSGTTLNGARLLCPAYSIYLSRTVKAVCC